MAPEEAPLRCLAVRAVADEAGEIDGLELELFMNAVAGPHQWISTTEWLFISPPAEAAGEITVPVVVPEAIAIKASLLNLSDLLAADDHVLMSSSVGDEDIKTSRARRSDRTKMIFATSFSQPLPTSHMD